MKVKFGNVPLNNQYENVIRNGRSVINPKLTVEYDLNVEFIDGLRAKCVIEADDMPNLPNYCCVQYTRYNNDLFIYYFVTSYRCIRGNVYELRLEKDLFTTYDIGGDENIGEYEHGVLPEAMPIERTHIKRWKNNVIGSKIVNYQNGLVNVEEGLDVRRIVTQKLPLFPLRKNADNPSSTNDIVNSYGEMWLYIWVNIKDGWVGDNIKYQTEFYYLGNKINSNTTLGLIVCPIAIRTELDGEYKTCHFRLNLSGGVFPLYVETVMQLVERNTKIEPITAMISPFSPQNFFINDTSSVSRMNLHYNESDGYFFTCENNIDYAEDGGHDLICETASFTSGSPLIYLRHLNIGYSIPLVKEHRSGIGGVFRNFVELVTYGDSQYQSWQNEIKMYGNNLTTINLKDFSNDGVEYDLLKLCTDNSQDFIYTYARWTPSYGISRTQYYIENGIYKELDKVGGGNVTNYSNDTVVSTNALADYLRNNRWGLIQGVLQGVNYSRETTKKKGIQYSLNPLETVMNGVDSALSLGNLIDAPSNLRSKGSSFLENLSIEDIQPYIEVKQIIDTDKDILKDYFYKYGYKCMQNIPIFNLFNRKFFSYVKTSESIIGKMRCFYDEYSEAETVWISDEELKKIDSVLQNGVTFWERNSFVGLNIKDWFRQNQISGRYLNNDEKEF